MARTADMEGLGYETAALIEDVVASTEADSMVDSLTALLHEASGYELDPRTFEEAGVLTSDSGFVVRMPSGTEFQATVVRSA